MQNRVGATLARVGRLFLIASFAGVTWLVAAASVSAQRATGAERPDDRNTSRVAREYGTDGGRQRGEEGRRSARLREL